MKQNIRTKWFALTLTAALALTTLTACGNGAGTASLPETPGTSAPLLEESGGVAGTVLLSVNPEIEMDYDDLGNVVALTGRNQEAQTLLASYTGYQGRPCTQVVGELVDEINALGYFDATVGGHEKNIILKLEDAYGYIDRFNRTRAEFSGLDRVDIRDYPPEAVREALLNALVHRDYAFSGPTLISIFEDRIEFVTIGGLARGIGLEDIRLGVSVLRNPDLANIFYRLRLIEAYGTGILRIHECYAGAAVQPAIEATDHAFKITLPNLNFSREAENTPPARPATSLGKREARVQKVIGLCRENGWVVRKDVEAALGVSQATAILLLREMTRDGLLEKQGTAKNLRYYLAEM